VTASLSVQHDLGWNYYTMTALTAPPPVQHHTMTEIKDFGQFSTALVVLRLLQSGAGYAIVCAT
jgi:hypothetical protein